MSAEAIAKVRAEMAANEKNPYVQVVGNFVIQHLTAHPADGEKVLAEDRTVLKSLDAMKKVAEKQKVGSVAVLTDSEGFEVVLKYFGIEAEATASPQSVSHANKFDVKLDDFL